MRGACSNQSRKRGWDLPDNPARLRIITIDSLGSWLAASSPVSSGGGALGSLRADAVPLYETAARMLLHDGIRLGDEDVQTLLRHLDGSGQQFTELVAGMLAKREQWLSLLGAEDNAGGAQRGAAQSRRTAKSAGCFNAWGNIAANSRRPLPITG